MALYSTDIRTRDLDPTTNTIPSGTNQTGKIEFMLPEGVYYPNLRLANVGAFFGAARTYNYLAGAYSCIKHIRLTSMGQELDAMRFANRYLAFTNLNAKNEENRSVNKKLNKSSVGYTEEIVDHKIEQRDLDNSNQAATSRDPPKLGHLDLRRCLPLLENLSVLPTEVFKNLKLVIEFEVNRSVVAMRDNTDVTIVPPVLLVDEVINPARIQSLMSGFNGAVWNKVEHDQVSVPAIANPAGAADKTPQDLTFRLNAFDDKFVSRLLFTKSLVDKTKYVFANIVRGTGDLGSLACHRERWNLKLNGGLVYPTNLDRESTRAAMLHDAYGNVNYIPFGDRETVGAEQPDTAALNNRSVPPLNGSRAGMLVGSMSFVGMSLNEKVEQLEVVFGRTAVNSGAAPTNREAKLADQDALDIHAFGEVRKALSVARDGSFAVSYL